MTGQAPQEGEPIPYGTADDAARVEALYESGTFWLDQRRIAERFGVEVSTLSYHLKNGYASGDLARNPILRRIPRVQRDRNREIRREPIINGFALNDERRKLIRRRVGKRDHSKGIVDVVRSAV